MEKLDMQTKNLADEKFEALKQLFPNAVTETKGDDGEVVRAVDKDVLMQEIATRVVEGRDERYQFTWPDKRQAILAANAPLSKTLRPAREESVNFDETENLYIEGDNLEVLKLLQETYLGKIKMIYIDPPYNTGNDFIYRDDFKQSAADYDKDSGVYDDDGNRMFKNTDTNGRFHSDWCSMIYSRLLLARNLLTDDGVIFISIDDNEYSTLKDLCDEIFGAEGFLATFVWKRRASSQMDKSKCSTDHEYVLAYKGKSFSALRGIDKDYKGYANPDNDPRGPWTLGDLTVGMTGDMRPNQYYDLVDPKTGKVYKPNYNRVWSYIPESMNQLIAENRIVFPEDISKRPMKKRFASELDTGTNPKSTWMDSVGMNTEGTKQMYDLFGKAFFSYTKPISLVKDLILQVASSSDIVLDFFSGSATTAHAVMDLNAEDGGNRKYILVQLPEETDEKSEAYKAGYKTICDIGKERIRRAGQKILEEHKDKESIEDLDIGFRVLKIDSSNMKDVYYEPDMTEQGFLDSFENNIKEDRSPEDLLFQVMLDLGIPLSADIQVETVGGKDVYVVEGGFFIACFDAHVGDEVVKAIAERKPYYAVFRDASMASDSVATNFDQIFESISPETVRRVL